MANQDYARIESDSDPDRCQAIMGTGQCRLKGIVLPDGTRGQYCLVHGGIGLKQAYNKAKMRIYQVEQWRERISGHVDNPQFKTITEEIGILRIALEARLNSCKDDIDLISNSEAISTLVDKISTTVERCHKMEVALKQVIDKNVLALYVEAIVMILDEEIEDQELKGKVADRMMQMLDKNIELEVVPSNGA